MGLILDRTQRLLLLLAPVAAIAVVAPNPASAATLAISQGEVNLYNFSHRPTKVSTLVDHQTSITGIPGQVTAGATANAQFSNDPQFPASAQNFSSSGAIGNGSAYTGMAKSSAKVMGRNFSIGAGETFSFNFDANLVLFTQINQPGYEAATASGSIQFELFDSTDRDNRRPLDFFAFSGILNTPGAGDELDQVASDSVLFAPNQMAFQRSFGGNQESATAEVQGLFAREFKTAMTLTLVETKVNQVTVQAPEPVSTPSLLLGGVAMLTKLITKRRKLSDPSE